MLLDRMRVVPAPVRFGMKEENPISGKSPETYEEAHFNDQQAYAIYDAYLMLRDAGFTRDDLRGIRTVINQTTIYDDEGAEEVYRILMKGEDVDEVL